MILLIVPMNLPINEQIDFLASILESPRGIIIFAIDKHYCYTTFSETHRCLMKKMWELDITYGMNALSLISNNDEQQKAKVNFDRALEGFYFSRIEEYGGGARPHTFYENYYGPIKDQAGNIQGASVFSVDLTELKHKENELRQSERRVSSILEIVPELSFKMDGQGKFLEIIINKTTDGFPQTGNSLFSMLPGHVVEKYKPAIKNCLQFQTIQAFDYALIENNNTHLYEARLIPCNEKEILVLVRNITFHERAELEFSTLSLIAKHTSNSVIITDRGGKIEWVNEGFTRITGYTPHEVYGKKPGHILQGKKSHTLTIAYMREKIKTGQPFTVEILNYTKLGSEFWVHITAQPIFNVAGEVARYFAIESDITARKLAEIKILEQNTRLTSATENLTRKNEQLEEFTQIVSHNLRSPIGNISALIEHFNATPADGDRREIIDHLKQSSDSLMVTLQELNEVLKIKYAGHIEKENVSFENIFQKVKHQLLRQVKEINATVTYNFLKAPVIFYPIIYVESIFVNLLSNALKYYSPSRNLCIHFESWVEDNTVKMSVADNGLGIDMDRYGHQVFKLRKTFHAHSESRGVGLFMIRNQVEAMGGEINISSKVDVGTTFLITFGVHEQHRGEK